MSSRIRITSSKRKLASRPIPSRPLDTANKAAAKKRAKKAHPDREAQFAMLWQSLAALQPSPESQYHFHPDRKWRFDFAWPDQKVAVEIDGGVFQKTATGHRSVSGVVRDAEKSNAAQVLGWCVLRFNSKDLDSKPAQVIQDIVKVICDRQGKQR